MSDHQGYQTRIGEKYRAPRATTICGMLDKPGLPWGAAKETALYAVYRRDEWLELDPAAAYETMRKHHRGVWDTKSNRGTQVHDFALQWSQGIAVDVPPDCAQYMDALENFYKDQEPVFVECERAVVYQSPNGDLDYGGRFDVIAKLNDYLGVGLLDYKTGGRYPTTTTMQLASYRYATGMGVHDELGRLVQIEPLPPIDYAAVVYLHDNGTYEVLEVPADEQAFEAFMHLRATYNWIKEADAWGRKHPERNTGPKVGTV